MPRHHNANPQETRPNFVPATLVQQSKISQLNAEINKSAAATFKLFTHAIFTICVGFYGVKFLEKCPPFSELFNLLSLHYKKQWTESSLQHVEKFFPGTLDHVPSSYNEFQKSIVGFIDYLNSREKEDPNYQETNVDYLLKDIYYSAPEQSMLEARFALGCVLSLLSPLVIKFLIDPATEEIMQHIRNFGSSNELLSDIKAKNKIIELKKTNAANWNWMKYLHYGNHAISIYCVATIIEIHKDMFRNAGIVEQGTPSAEVIQPDLLIFATLSMFFTFSTLFSFLRKQYNESRLQEKCFNAQKTFDEALSFTGGQCCVHRHTSLANCYLEFKAESYKNLVPSAIVNQVVKDILLKNGLEILHYNKNDHTLELSVLKPKTIKKIKTQVETFLERYLQIKILSSQLNNFFSSRVPIYNIKTGTGDLPTAEFYFAGDLTDDRFKLLKQTFPGCEILKSDNYISIFGFTPSTEIVRMAVVSGSAVSKPTTNQTHSKKIIKPAKAALENEIPLAPTPAVVEEKYQWSVGIYTSLNPLGDIRRINHPIFGRNHFVLFSIPKECFPEGYYKILKQKVEEATMATSAVGQQGLQFRVGKARDETRPKRPWFLSSMRYKSLGTKLGDIRCYAEVESKNDTHLFVFKGVTLSSH